MNLRALLRGAVALVVGLAFASSYSAQAEGTSENFGQIHFSKYFLNNNVWGREDSPAGWNAIWNSNNTSPVWWGTAYNWPVNGNPNSVKAYPSIISGWHWGTWSANSGLPVRIWENKNLSTGASFTIQNAGVQNVAYDCWFHTIPNPTWENQPTDELMVWLSSYGGAGPLGTLQETVWIAGQQWRVYKGNIGWNVYSFVRTTNTDSWSFNLRDFVNHVTYNKGWMANSRYVTSVQFGTEVFSTAGNGQLDVSNYRLDVN